MQLQTWTYLLAAKSIFNLNFHNFSSGSNLPQCHCCSVILQPCWVTFMRFLTCDGWLHWVEIISDVSPGTLCKCLISITKIDLILGVCVPVWILEPPLPWKNDIFNIYSVIFNLGEPTGSNLFFLSFILCVYCYP